MTFNHHKPWDEVLGGGVAELGLQGARGLWWTVVCCKVLGVQSPWVVVGTFENPPSRDVCSWDPTNP